VVEDGPLLAYREAIGCSIEYLADNILRRVQSVSENPVVLCRVKDTAAVIKKMELKGARSLFELEDIYGIRVLVSQIQEVYAALEVMSEAFPGYLDHDYIKTPKTRPDKPALKGKSLRLLQFIAYKDGIPFEIQITTHEYHRNNEALHRQYHAEKYG